MADHNQERVLVVDDDPGFLEVISFQLSDAGYQVVSARDGEQGLLRFREDPFPVVVTDLKMPGMDGLELMAGLHRQAPETLVIMVTAFGDISTAVEAMRRGAYDFVPKPFERDHLLHVLARAFRHRALETEVVELRARVGSESKSLVFRSRAMTSLVQLADRVAATDANVLVVGESGTGKELLVRRIHQNGPRARGPFVAINCASIPKDLLESELFGHTRGAFTGAVRDRKGRFEQARHGTLFLDEIGEMAPELQARLLRVLQEGVVDVLGSERSVSVDVRVIAATNRDPRQAMEEGRLREDLYYRLATFVLQVPPLRERREDIPGLISHFLSGYGRGRKLSLSPGVMARLEAQAWPGNVRELENICQRLALMADQDRITEEILPALGLSGDDPGVLDLRGQVRLPEEGLSLEELERSVILKALEMNDYNQSAAARFLQIPRHVLVYRMEKFEIPSTRG